MISEDYGDGEGTWDANAFILEWMPSIRDWLYKEALRLINKTPRRFETGLSDSLVQEGYIAMWRAAHRVDPSRGDPGGYLLYQIAEPAMARFLFRNESRLPTGERGHSGDQDHQGGAQTRETIRTFMATWKAEHGVNPTGAQVAKGLGWDGARVYRQMAKMNQPTEDVVKHVASLDGYLEDREGGEGFLDIVDMVRRADEVFGEVALAYHQGEIVQAINSLDPDHRAYVVDRFWNGLSDVEIAAKRGFASTTPLRTQWKRDIVPALVGRLEHLASAL